MGLASKLAAAQAAQGGGAPPAQGGYPPQQAQPGQKPPYPGANSYTPYPGGNSQYGGQQRYSGQQPYQGQPSYQQSYSPRPPPQQPPYQNYQQQPPSSPHPPYGQQGQYYSSSSVAPPQPPRPPPGQYGAASPYPPQPSYGTKPGAGYAQQQSQYAQQSQPPAYPPQGQQYGAPPPGGQQYGAPPGAADPRDVGAYKTLLQGAIRDKGLEPFIPPNSPMLDQIAAKAPAQVAQLCQRWNVPKEVGQDIVKLALWDIVIFIDNSGSMRFEDRGERIDDLNLILSRAAYAATLFDEDGISLRFMNFKPSPYDNIQLDKIKSEDQILSIVGTSKQEGSIRFQGLTPLGTELRNQVIDGIIMRDAKSQTGLKKPVLVIAITDGQPAGESKDALEQALRYTNNEFGRMQQRYGRAPVAFSFAQVGNDLKAREFLADLDSNKEFGGIIDCTSNFENEQEEFMRNTGQDLTPDLWLIKLLLGAIDPSYDTQDEKQGPRPPTGQYSAPPPQGYPPQQHSYQQGGGYPQQPGYGQPPPPQSYGQQPPQGYNRPPPQQPGYPQQYPPQQGGYPPQGQQGGYQQQGYPGQQQQQGSYAPPPPPRY